MKNRLSILSVILCVVTAMFMLAACSDPGAPKHAVSEENYVVSAEACEQKVEEYVTGYPNRTSGTTGEENAAKYLQGKLIEYQLENITLEGFTVPDTGKKSNNVVAYYKEDGAQYNVIIGAYYDNCYDLVSSRTSEQILAEGALANATGVAAVLSVAEYLGGEHGKLGFNVTIVFFGSAAVDTTGAAEYYKSMSKSEKANTVLMVELQRLGVDHVYAYTGPSTKREGFFERVASDNKFDIYKTTQKSPHLPGMSILDGVPYYEWAQTGLYDSFYNGGIPTLNVVGANWETIDITDSESIENPNIAFTSGDTLANLKRLYPGYGKKIALASSFIIASLNDGEFLSVMNADKASFNPNNAITKGWIWGLVLIGILLIAYIVTNLIVKHLEKKYPVVAAKPKNIKISVFGVDYEDRKPDDIFIDFADPFSGVGEEEIFPGIPNNKSGRTAVNPEDIFGARVRRDGFDASKPQSQRPSDPFDVDTVEIDPDIVEEYAEPTGQDNKKPDAETAAPENKKDSDNMSAPDGMGRAEEKQKTDAAREKTEAVGSDAPVKTEKPKTETASKKTESAAATGRATKEKSTDTTGELTKKTAAKKTAAKKTTTKSGLTGKAATTGKATTKTAKPETEKSEDIKPSDNDTDK